MTIETTLKDKESGHDYPVQIEYELDHNDGNYPTEFDVNIISVKVPVGCEIPTGSGYWEKRMIWLTVWKFDWGYGEHQYIKKEAIQAVRDWIEGNRIEAEEGRMPE